jgi:hypothetical protein
MDEEVRDPATIHDPSTTAFNTHAGTAQSLAHLGQRSGPVLQFN